MSCKTCDSSDVILAKERYKKNHNKLRDINGILTAHIESVAPIKKIIQNIECLVRDKKFKSFEAARRAESHSLDASELEDTLENPDVIGCDEKIAELKEKIAELWRKAHENVALATDAFIVRTKCHPHRLRAFLKFSRDKLEEGLFNAYYTPTSEGNFQLYIQLTSTCDLDPCPVRADYFLDGTFQLQFVKAVRENGLTFVDDDPIVSQNFDIKAPETCKTPEPCNVAKHFAERQHRMQKEALIKLKLRELGVPYY
jgi:hypothetical protein